MDDVTSDLFFNGKIIVKQPAVGYRYSIDPIILTHFITPSPDEFIIDLGTGCGIIPVILACKYPGIKIWGIEIQTDLSEIAINNIKKNHLESQITILNQNIKSLSTKDTKIKCDRIISNPPYMKKGAGRINPDIQKAIARHELKINIEELLKAAYSLLKHLGKFSIIYPSGRLTDLVWEMKNTFIEPKVLRFVHPRKNQDAKLVMVEGVKNGRPGIKTLPPLYIYEEGECYTNEINKMFE